MKRKRITKMPWTSKHTEWLAKTDKPLKTIDGKEVEVWVFQHKDDQEILSLWAKHFRNHYCLDTDIEFLRGKLTRPQYLTKIKFPSRTTRLGPAIRAGDFGEILVADYLQYILDFWVPRVRWSSKTVRDESPKGSDVIGFKFHKKKGEISNEDELFVIESKTKFSNSPNNRLQDAVNGSAKDHIRIDESLNLIKQKLYERKKINKARRVERFQSPVDIPYKETYGAAAIISDERFDTKELTKTDCSKIPNPSDSKQVIPHPNGRSLSLLVIKGADMMNLVHELYRRAAHEA